MAAAKAGLRGLLRDLHLYLSLAAGLFLVAIAITGAPLVWRDDVDRFLNPGRYAVTGEELRQPLSRYAENARAAAGEEFGVLELRLPARAGWPVQAILRAAATGGAPARTLVATLDPPTGRVLDLAGMSSTLVGVLHNFHHMLMVPQWSGRQIVGWFGVVLLFLALSGLYLWWPRNGPFARGLRWRRSPWTSTNLHQFAGFWISVPLAIVAATGIYLAFPNTAWLLMSSLTPTGQPMRHGGYSALGVRETKLGPDGALAKALALAPGAQPRTISFPTQQARQDHQHGKPGGGTWRIRLQESDGVEPVAILVSDESATAQRAAAPQSGDRAASLIKGLHEARRGGPVWAFVVFVTGVAPAIFMATGLIMWLRGRRARLDTRRV